MKSFTVKYLLLLVTMMLVFPTDSFSKEENIKKEKIVAIKETPKALSAAIFAERISEDKFNKMISGYKNALLNQKNIQIPCEEVQKKFDDDMLDYVSKSFSYQAYLRHLAGNMSNNFTTDELKIILEFYKTDAGKKMSRFDEGFKMIVSQYLQAYIQRSYTGLAPIYVKYSDADKMCKLLQKNKQKNEGNR